MTLKDQIRTALKRAYAESGTLEILAKKTSVSHGLIANFINDRRSADNMRVTTMQKLFPDMRVYFFRDELPEAANSGLTPIARQIASIVDKIDPAEQAQILASLAALYPQHVTNTFSQEPKSRQAAG